MQLLYTTGSPFARMARVVLDEIGIAWEPIEEITTPSVEERAAHTPTLQVPTLHTSDRDLWGSALICEWLMETHAERTPASPPLAPAPFRPEAVWDDRLVLTTVQTLGEAATTVSQMTWGGAGVGAHAHADRCAARVGTLLGWLEDRLETGEEGYWPGRFALSDAALACHLDFIVNRPLGIDPEPDRHPKVAALLDRARARESFRKNPIYWWEPGVTGYGDDGTPIYD